MYAKLWAFAAVVALAAAGIGAEDPCEVEEGGSGKGWSRLLVLEEVVAQQRDTIASQGGTIAAQGEAIAAQGGTIASQGEAIASQGETIAALTASQGEAIAALTARFEELAGRPPPRGGGGGGGGGEAVIAALAERTRAIEDNLFKPRDQGEYQKEQRRRRAEEAEVNGKGDLPGVGITADEATRTLNLGGHTKIMGDLTVEGSIYVQNFTRVRGGGWVVVVVVAVVVLGGSDATRAHRRRPATAGTPLNPSFAGLLTSASSSSTSTPNIHRCSALQRPRPRSPPLRRRCPTRSRRPLRWCPLRISRRPCPPVSQGRAGMSSGPTACTRCTRAGPSSLGTLTTCTVT